MDCGLLLRGTGRVLRCVHVVSDTSRSESRFHPLEEELLPYMGSQQTPRSNDMDTGDSSVLSKNARRRNFFSREAFSQSVSISGIIPLRLEKCCHLNE